MRSVVFILAALVLSACNPPTPVNTCAIGDTKARAQAYVPATLAQRHFDAREIGVGLGSAAIGEWDSLGDALTVGGRAWLRTTNPDSPRYFASISNRYFQSNNFAYVPPGTTAAAQQTVQAGNLADLHTALARDYPHGVIAAGFVRFAELRMIAIARAPIKGVPIRGNAQHYYTRPMETAHGAWAYVVMIAGNAEDLWLRRVLPEQRAGYMHALVLNEAPLPGTMEPLPDNVRQVGEVVDDAMIAEGRLALYPVTRIGECDGPR